MRAIAGEVIDVAYVEIRSKIDPGFNSDVRDAVRDSLKPIGKDVDRALAPAREAIQESLGDAFQDAAHDVDAAMDGISKTVKKSLGGVTKDAEQTKRSILLIEKQIADLRREAADRVELDINADTSDIDAKVRRLNANLKTLQSTVVDVPVDVDTSGAAAQIKALQAQLNGIGDGRGPFDGIGKSLKSFSDGLGLVAKGAGIFTAVGTAVAGLGPVLVGATAAVVALGGAIGLAAGSAFSLGGVAASLGLAFATVKIASSGVGEAMKAQSAAQAELAATGEVSAATQEKLDAAMKNLAPAAREVVKAMGEISKEFAGVRKSIQQDLFAGQADNLRRMADVFLPAIEEALGSVARSLNAAGDDMTDFFTKGDGAGKLESLIQGLAGVFNDLIPAFGNVGAALLNLFVGGIPASRSLADSIVAITQRFQEFTERITASGQFADFLKRASEAAGELLGFLGNLGKVLVGVFGAGAENGVSLLASMSDGLADLSDKINSVAGQKALSDFFDTIGVAGNTLGAVISALGPLFASMFATLSPIFNALAGLVGSLATGIADGLTPVFEALEGPANSVAAAMSTLGPLFEKIGVVIGPLVLLITGLAVALKAAAIAQGLLNAVALLNPYVAAAVGVAALVAGLVLLYQRSETVREAFSGIGSAIGSALDGVQSALGGLDLSTLGAGASEAIEALKGVLTSLGPVLETVFNGYIKGAADLLTSALIPAFQKVGDFIGGTILPHLADLGRTAQSQLIPAVQALANTFVNDIQPAFVQFFAVLQDKVLPVFLFLGKVLLAVVKPVQKLAFVVLGVLIKALAKLGPIIGFVFRAITKIIEVLFSAGTAVKAVGQFFVGLWNTLMSVGTFIGTVFVGAFRILAGVFQTVVMPAVNLLVGIFNNVLVPAFNVVATVVSVLLVNAFRVVAGFLQGTFNNVISGIGVVFNALLVPLRAVATFLLTNLVAGFRVVWSFIQTNILPIFLRLVDFFSSRLLPIFRVVASFITGTIVPAFRRIGEFIRTSVIPVIQSLISKALDMKTRLGTYVNNVVTAFSTMKTKITGFINGIKTVIQGLIDKGKGLGTALGDNFKSGISGIVNGVIDKINGLIGAFNKLPGGDIGKIPRLARGGIFNRETLAVVGEAGKEAVIPVTRANRAAALIVQSGLADIPAVQRAILARLQPTLSETTSKSLAGMRQGKGPFASPALSSVARGVLSRSSGAPAATTVAGVQSTVGPTRVVNNNQTQNFILPPVTDPGALADAFAARVAEDSER